MNHYIIPKMSPAEEKDFETNVKLGLLIGFASGLAIAHFGSSQKPVNYLLLAALGTAIGGGIPVLAKLKKVNPEKETVKQDERRDPFPAPSLAMSEQMIVENKFD